MSERTKQPARGDDARCDDRCDELQQLILRSQRPDDALPNELDAHLEQCPSCQAFRAQLVTLDALTREQAPELPEGFKLDLRRRLNEVDKAASSTKPGRRRIRVALAAAAVALITAGALLAARLLQSPTEHPTYHRLKLSIRSVQAYDEVLFDVELPEGAQLLPATGAVIGRGRNLSWRSPVQRGLNGFDLPLSARSASGIVKVRLRAGGRVWRGTVPLGNVAKAASITEPKELRLAWVLAPGPTGGAR